MSEAFRMVRQFGQAVNEPDAYRVETTRLMTEAEALQLMRDLGSPYKGQRYPNDPSVNTEPREISLYDVGALPESVDWRARCEAAEAALLSRPNGGMQYDPVCREWYPPGEYRAHMEVHTVDSRVTCERCGGAGSEPRGSLGSCSRCHGAGYYLPKPDLAGSVGVSDD